MADHELLRRLRADFDKKLIGKKPKLTCRACSTNKQDRHCAKHEIKYCNQCKQKITEAHMHVDFVGHAHVTARMLDIDPEWDWEPLGRDPHTGAPCLDSNGGIWIKLTIGGITRIGYGGADGKTGDDAVKEAISDAIKTTAMRFGIGLDLWMREKPEPEEAKPKATRATTQKTEREQANELRAQLKAIGEKRGMDVPALSDDFAAWSRGSDITQASPVTLTEYKDHLLNRPLDGVA